MFKRKGIPFKIVALLFGLVALAMGVYITFFQSRGFVKTTATIASITEVESEFANEDPEHVVEVTYTIDGKSYTAELDAYSPSYKEGKQVTILYDPNDPAVIHSGLGFGIYVLAVGVVLLAGVAVTEIKSRRGLQNLRETVAETYYAPSVQGEERTLYFLTDTGTAKYGHRIEDENRRVLYEAKVTKFTLTAPTGFDFIDHVQHRTTPHLVGHEESTERNSLLIDDYSTFTFDGEDIWDHLKRNGIRVESGFMDGKPLWLQYQVYRDGREFARIESSSAHVHEEDAQGKLGRLVPSRGYYRIYTREENLDLLFVTLLAFARTSSADGTGGNLGMFFGNREKGKRE